MKTFTRDSRYGVSPNVRPNTNTFASAHPLIGQLNKFATKGKGYKYVKKYIWTYRKYFTLQSPYNKQVFTELFLRLWIESQL